MKPYDKGYRDGFEGNEKSFSGFHGSSDEAAYERGYDQGSYDRRNIEDRKK